MAEHEVKIKVTANEKPAVKSIKALTIAFKGFQRVASTVMRTLGLFGLAVNGAKILIDGFKTLKGWLDQCAAGVDKVKAAINLSNWRSDIEFTCKSLLGLHNVLSKINKENQEIEKNKSAIANLQTNNERAKEDETKSLNRRIALASVDDEETKQKMLSTFAEEDAATASKRKIEDKKVEAESLRDAITTAELNNEQITPRIEKIEEKLEQLIEERSKAHGEKFENERRLIDENENALKSELNALKEDAKENERIIQFKQQQLDIVEKEIEEEQKMNALRSQAANAEKAQKERIKINEQREKDNERRKEIQEEINDRANKEDEEKEQKKLSREADFTSRLASASRSGKDRLTSMGLSSGNIVDRSAQQQLEQLKKLVELGQKQLEATQNNNQSSTGTFAP